jgi:nucleoside-diphosphate-sugar epimerase
MPTVLIVGATGFIGTRVCEKFHSLGYRVLAFKRPASDISHIKPYVYTFLTSDLFSASCIHEISNQLKSQPIDYLISLAGAVDYHQTYELARKANVDTTKTIIQIAIHLQTKAALKMMAFGGSVTSRGFMKKAVIPLNMLNESSDYLVKGLSVYCEVKREAEDLVNTAIKKKNSVL